MHPSWNPARALPPVALVALAVFTGRAVAQEQLTKLLPADSAPHDHFGSSVSVRGTLAVVGSYGDDDNGTQSGSAYLFDVTTGAELQKLLPGDGAAHQGFGGSVSLSTEHALIGALYDYGGSLIGSAYLFDVHTGQQLYQLLASDGAIDDWFGGSVAISGTGALIGAYRDDDLGSESGSAYLFDAGTGQELFKLLAIDGAAGDRFGWSVAIDGNCAVVGAYQDDDHGTNSGSAHVFDAHTGQHLFKLLPSNGEENDAFGYSVAVSGDRAIIGARSSSTTGAFSGAAYVFDVNTGLELHQLIPLDGGRYDYFGDSVSIHGEHALVGAQGDDDHGGGSGSAYLFDVNTGQQVQKLLATDGTAGDWFGASVSLNGTRAVIGAPGSADNGTLSGAAYVFAAVEPGIRYCFGDPGIGTACPCRNDNDGNIPGSGCANGVFSSGAHLVASGIASISDDTLVLTTTGLEPLNTGLYFQGDNAVNGGDGTVFGDGLRCAGGDLIRLQVRVANGAGVSGTTVPIAARAGVVAGETKRYQCWYRSTLEPPCGVGVNDFNTSNGYEVTWLP